MRLLRSARWLALALLLLVIPATSHAGVFISVGFAPPVLPVYVQPECPEPGLMWMPGYWAYGPDGYYWVPGAWVPAPYEGALWTPPYWGWDENVYVFHPGYWGRHVGYYGGVNYGFGYMGVGFVGGEWRGHDFAYNTAVVHVNRTVIRNTYVNETIVHNTTIVNNRVAYAGGPGGVRHEPGPEERMAMHEAHVAPTSFQQQHMLAAQSNHAAYFNANHGRPANVVAERPLAAQHLAAPMERPNNAVQAGRPVMGGANGGRPAPGYQQPNRPNVEQGNRPAPGYQQPGRPVMQEPNRPAAGYQQPNRPAPQQMERPGYQPQPRTEPSYPQQGRPQSQPQSRPEPQGRPQYQPRPEQQARPEQHAQPRPEPRSEPRQESRPHESHH